MECALKVLEKVNYFSPERTTNQLRLMVELLNSEVTSLRNSNVFFCSMSASAGKSTESILQKVRDLAHMDTRQYDDKFLYLNDLEQFKNDKARKKIIFVDDFIGSGGTVENLHKFLLSKNFYNKHHNYYIGIIVGYENVVDQIETSTPFRIIHAEELLQESSKIFHKDNVDFNTKEKTALKNYCKLVDPRPDYVYGYKNTQSLVIFFENAPNNSIPILHHPTSNWTPLFPRLE